MKDKLRIAVALIAKAVSRPDTVIYALRERGWRHVLGTFFRSDPVTIAAMTRDLQFRSLPPTQENLNACYARVQFLALEEERLYKVGIPTGEEFLIRRSRGWADLGTLHEIFDEGIYADHPPIAGKTVLDIGANIGDTAVYFAERGARVVAYEPDPEMCELARRNVAGNGLVADIRNAGIGAATEMLALSATPDGADTMSVTLFPERTPVNRLHAATLPIRVVAFADVLTELGSVELLKIDCEGCEYPALATLTRADLRRIKHVMMEYHGESGPLEDKLRACGFSVRLKGTMYMYADRVDEP